jgi:antitoxin component of MazEF toxin-antitoxin module
MAYPKTTLLECYSGRFWKIGGTWGMILPPDVRNYFRLTPGELMLITIDQTQGVIVARPARRKMVYDSKRGLHVPGPDLSIGAPAKEGVS